MYFYDDKQHHTPHIYVKYQDEKAAINISNGGVISGSLSNKQLKLVQAWIEIHHDELLADWELATTGEQVFKIDPLK
jgi:desulfoferrodoxin (superoxide reductase-like protein)